MTGGAEYDALPGHRRFRPSIVVRGHERRDIHEGGCSGGLTGERADGVDGQIPSIA
jgi:hypothetical protein